MIRLLSYLAAALCIVGIPSLSSAHTKSERLDYRALTPKIIEALESRIKMPIARRPLTSYVRYYTLVYLENGAPYIEGTFVSTMPGQGYWKVVPPDEMPSGWTDGGCGRLSFGAYFRTMKIHQPLCNFG